MVVFTLVIALFVIAVAIFNVVKKKHCTDTVYAIYLESRRIYTGKGITRYQPIFCYTFQGIQYTKGCGEALSEKKLYKQYQPGESYEIFINPQKPQYISASRNAKAQDIFLLILGVIFLLCSLLIK